MKSPHLIAHREAVAGIITSKGQATQLIAEGLSDGIYSNLLWVVEALGRSPTTAFEDTATLMRGLSPHFNDGVKREISAGKALVLAEAPIKPTRAATVMSRSPNVDTNAALGWLAERGVGIVILGSAPAPEQPAIRLDTDPQKAALREQFSSYVWPVTAPAAKLS